MTEESARRVANAVMGAAAAAAIYVIVRNPPLRRAAWRLAATAVTATLPAWLGGEVRRAWTDSGTASRTPRRL